MAQQAQRALLGRKKRSVVPGAVPGLIPGSAAAAKWWADRQAVEVAQARTGAVVPGAVPGLVPGSAAAAQWWAAQDAQRALLGRKKRSVVPGTIPGLIGDLLLLPSGGLPSRLSRLLWPGMESLSPELFLDLLPDLLLLTSGGRPSGLSVPFLPKSKLPANLFLFYHHKPTSSNTLSLPLLPELSWYTSLMVTCQCIFNK